MEWRQIEAFYSLVRLGSMTRAAEAQYRPQPALSQQISRLEEELGCLLLERIGKKGFTLTPAGEEFYRFSENMLYQKKHFLERIQEISGNSIGTITVAAPLIVLLFLFPGPVRKYINLYPNVNIHIIEKSPQECLDLLKRGEIDFGFIHGSTVPKTLNSYEWITGRFKVAVPKGHELCNESPITLERLSHYPINIVPKNLKLSARDRLDKKFDELGISYNIGLESPSSLLNLKYASFGFGVTFLMCYGDILDNFFKDELVFIDMNHIFPDDVLSIVCKANLNVNEPKIKFLEVFLSEYNKEY